MWDGLATAKLTTNATNTNATTILLQTSCCCFCIASVTSDSGSSGRPRHRLFRDQSLPTEYSAFLHLGTQDNFSRFSFELALKSKIMNCMRVNDIVVDGLELCQRLQLFCDIDLRLSATHVCGPNEHCTPAHDLRRYFPLVVGFVGSAVLLVGRSSGRLYGRIKAAQAPDFHLTHPLNSSSYHQLCSVDIITREIRYTWFLALQVFSK